MRDWIQGIFRRFFRSSQRYAKRPRFRPTLEYLDKRELLNAATWTVDTTSDTPMGDPTKQAGSLRYCVQNAASGDTIVFSNQIFGQTINLASPILLGQNGLTNLTIDGGTNSITISGQNLTRLFQVFAGSSDTIQNLTLADGVANDGLNGGAVRINQGAALNAVNDTFDGNSSIINGGAIQNDGTLTDTNSVFSNNSANAGGAIANDGTLNETGSTFIANTAKQGSGGAITNAGQLTENGSTFTGNTAPQGNGGAIESNSGGAFQQTINNSKFYNNGAISGGAIDTSDDTTLDSDIFNDANVKQPNIAAGGDGGALRTTRSATLTNDKFYGNQAFANNGVGGNGGAIVNSGVLKIDNQSMFVSNAAGVNGGAIENSSALNINLSTFASNAAVANGGAIDSNAGNGNGQLVISNSSLYGNQADIGGAINTVDDTILSNDEFGAVKAGQTSNVASAGGGAVSAAAGTTPSNTLTVLDSDFISNQVLGAGRANAFNFIHIAALV